MKTLMLNLVMSAALVFAPMNVQSADTFEEMRASGSFVNGEVTYRMLRLGVYRDTDLGNIALGIGVTEYAPPRPLEGIGLIGSAVRKSAYFCADEKVLVSSIEFYDPKGTLLRIIPSQNISGVEAGSPAQRELKFMCSDIKPAVKSCEKCI